MQSASGVARLSKWNWCGARNIYQPNWPLAVGLQKMAFMQCKENSLLGSMHLLHMHQFRMFMRQLAGSFEFWTLRIVTSSHVDTCNLQKLIGSKLRKDADCIYYLWHIVCVLCSDIFFCIAKLKAETIVERRLCVCPATIRKFQSWMLQANVPNGITITW